MKERYERKNNEEVSIGLQDAIDKDSHASPVITPIKNYIKKRKAINFTMSDLEKGKEDDQDKDFIANIEPIGETRNMPERQCTKKGVMDYA